MKTLFSGKIELLCARRCLRGHLSLFVKTKSPAQLPTPNRLWETPLSFEDKQHSVFLGGRAQAKIADARKVVNDTTQTEGAQA
jgi:hypothetical protein